MEVIPGYRSRAIESALRVSRLFRRLGLHQDADRMAAQAYCLAMEPFLEELEA